MMSIVIQLPAESETVLVEQATRSGLGIEQYLTSLIQRNLPRKKSNEARLSKRESELFAIINQGFPEKFWVRWRELDEKRFDETLTDEELEELLEKNEQIEIANTNRVVALSKLAKLRKMDLYLLMRQLQIPRNGETFH